MVLQDKQKKDDELNNLVKKFIEASTRKRKNLIKDIEASVEGIYDNATELFAQFDREGDDWAVGWILQVLKKNKPEFLSIINILEDFEDVVFSRLTGSGSCIYSVFEKKEHAVNAQKNFQQNFYNLWTHVSENNLTNLF